MARSSMSWRRDVSSGQAFYLSTPRSHGASRAAPFRYLLPDRIDAAIDFREQVLGG